MFRLFLLLLFIVSLTGLLVPHTLRADEEPGIKVHILDVGQGESILLTSQVGHHILIDTGGDGQRLLGELHRILPPWHRRIDLLILTHSDQDHVGALDALLAEYPVHHLLTQMVEPEGEKMADVVHRVERAGGMIHHADPMQDLHLGPGLSLDVLMPLPQFTPGSSNDASLVIMAVIGGETLLLTGDLEEAGERALVHHGRSIQATWFAGGHHGSKTSSSELFLRAVRPQGALFSNGLGNSYGHPAKEVVDRLASHHISLYNTSTHGAMTLTCRLLTPCFLTTTHDPPGSH